MSVLAASVQYNDFKGTSAADRSDHVSINSYLMNKGLINPGEFLISVRFFVGENHKGEVRGPYIEALLLPDTGSFETARELLEKAEDPLSVRSVTLDLSIEEFLGLFKRFEVLLTPKGLGLDGREVRIQE